MTSEAVQVHSGPWQIGHSAKIITEAFSQPNAHVHIWPATSCRQAGLPAKSHMGCLPAEV